MKKRPCGYERKKIQEELDAKRKKFLERVPKISQFFSDNNTETTSAQAQHNNDAIMEVESTTNCTSPKISSDTQKKGGTIEPSKNCNDDDNTPSCDSFPSSVEVEPRTNDNPESNFMLMDYSDPATWTIINETTMPLILEHLKVQDINNLNFSSSRKFYDGRNWYASKSMFFTKHINGEIKRRDWLFYSQTKNEVFCVHCLLFCDRGQTYPNNAFTTGLSDWKNISLRTARHERSLLHRKNSGYFVNRRNHIVRIDTHLESVYLQEKVLWRNILLRITSVIRHLAVRGLPFRGRNQRLGSPQNGNYLGCLELISEFDPVLKNHLETRGNKGEGTTSYLSSDICDEFISIMGQKIIDKIISDLKEAKYFSMIVDSTPDVSHSDQLAIIYRYILPNSHIVERFITFVENAGHKSEEMEESILQILNVHNINILDCRGQSYDNASNMAGMYSGLQARIKSRNDKAVYIPCSAHSLNLVGVAAAECCLCATSFFMFVQELFVFLSSSTHRWQCLQKNIKQFNISALLPKSLSTTRWSARADACKALKLNFMSFKATLEEISEDQCQKATTRAEADGIASKFSDLETGILLSLWSDILTRFDRTNKSLQKVDVNLVEVVQLYDSLLSYIHDLRNSFEQFETLGKELSRCDDYKIVRIRVRKHQFDEGADDCNPSARERFRINTYLVIIDTILQQLERRKSSYTELREKFQFLFLLPKPDANIGEIKERAQGLQKFYPDDLDDDFPEESVHFCDFLKTAQCHPEATPRQLLEMIRDKKIESTFPNIEIGLRIYLTIPASNASAERSFSVLKRIKNYSRNRLNEEKLSYLSVLCINSDLTLQLDFEDVIDKFSSLKARKVVL